MFGDEIDETAVIDQIDAFQDAIGHAARFQGLLLDRSEERRVGKVFETV